MFRLWNSMISKEFELLCIRFINKEQTLRFGIGISLFQISLNYFVLYVQGMNRLCISLKEFHDFHGV